MVISSELRVKIRGALTGLGFRRTGYTNVTEPGGAYTETWSLGDESVTLAWEGYPAQDKREWEINAEGDETEIPA